ncbi:hypothetical protein ACOMHN_050245 [Nucella lapillus]
MVVFFKHGLKQRINLCLFCLSLVDLVFVTVGFLVYAEKIDGTFTKSYRDIGHFAGMILNNHIIGLYSGSIFSSQFISAVIAGERCLCVVWPLRFNDLLKTKTIGIVLMAGVLLIFGTRFVVGMKFRMQCLIDVETGLTVYYLTSSEFHKANEKLVEVLDSVITGLFLPLFLGSFVTATTIITAASLQKSTQFQKESSSFSSSSSFTASAPTSARNVAVTKMLIYLSVQFVVINTPSMLFRTSLVFLPHLSPYGNWAHLYFSLTAVTELCGLLSSSINFLIYYFFGTKYRKSVQGMLCKCRNVLSTTDM